VGYGDYAKPKYDLGVEEDVVIPASIRPLSVQRLPSDATNIVQVTLDAPDKADLRIVLRQFANGKPLRTSAGAPPNGITLANLLKIEVSQNQRPLPVVCHYDKAIWSGLSWGVGEVRRADLEAGRPIAVRCTSLDKQPAQLQVECFAVTYH
jgi:hypothetical protein